MAEFEFSVGVVSGLIAAGVFVLQLLLSLIFPAALIGFVGEENTAVTWSVLGRALQASPWPTLLQTDAAARQGVRRRVSNGLLLQTAIVLLVSVAAIVTPLGLYQTVEPDGTELDEFQFIMDESPFGYGTPPRIPGPFSRSCGNGDPCPGSWVSRTCTVQGLLRNCTDVVYGRSMPDIWRTTFRDGARQVGQSVSSILDMQWRNQVNASDPFGESGWYLKSGYRQIGILILDPSIQLVDGLIVDAQSGGIGFRNHTVPLRFHEHGSTWTEDILFVEPEAQCVDLNVTFDFRLAQDSDADGLVPRDLVLTDRGGFSGLARTSPDLSIPEHGNGQGPLDLRDRAYKAAWSSNFLTLAFFNKTDPDPNNITRLDVTPGMAFQSGGSQAGVNSTVDKTKSNIFAIEYQALRSSLYFGEYLQGNSSNSTANPFKIGTSHFNRVSEICAGGSHTNQANINSSLVGCGLVYGSARRTDGGSELSPQPNSQWSLPVYSCAASVRATIRTLTFTYNGTSPSLASLKVTSSRPKTYPSPSSSHPDWAVESLPRFLTLADAQPLWGILPASNPPSLLNTNLTTHRSPHLLLPGILTSTTPLLTSLDYTSSKLGQNLPGVNFYTQALQNAFMIARPGTAGFEGFADYSGMTGLALYRKWQQGFLGKNNGEEGAAEVVRLVWTDVAANAVVGTKGWGLGGGDDGGVVKKKRDGEGSQGRDEKVPVTVYRRRVRYRLPYMVPAIVALVLAVGVSGTWVGLVVVGRTGPGKMRRLLDATSSGRILGGFLWPGAAAGARRTEEWVKRVGTKVVVVGEGASGAVAREGGNSGEGRDGEVKVGEESVQLMGKEKRADGT